MAFVKLKTTIISQWDKLTQQALQKITKVMKAWGLDAGRICIIETQGFYQEMYGFPVMFFAWTSNYGWFIVENPIKMDDLEVRPFQGKHLWFAAQQESQFQYFCHFHR